MGEIRKRNGSLPITAGLGDGSIVHRVAQASGAIGEFSFPVTNLFVRERLYQSVIDISFLTPRAPLAYDSYIVERSARGTGAWIQIHQTTANWGIEAVGSAAINLSNIRHDDLFRVRGVHNTYSGVAIDMAPEGVILPVADLHSSVVLSAGAVVQDDDTLVISVIASPPSGYQALGRYDDVTVTATASKGTATVSGLTVTYDPDELSPTTSDDSDTLRVTVAVGGTGTNARGGTSDTTTISRTIDITNADFAGPPVLPSSPITITPDLTIGVSGTFDPLPFDLPIAAGGQEPITYFLTGNPAGTSLSQSIQPLLVGVPNVGTQGTHAMEFHATDSLDRPTNTVDITVVVKRRLIWNPGVTSLTMTEDEFFTHTFNSAQYGHGSYDYFVSTAGNNDDLPNGLTLNGRTLSGTPTESGSFDLGFGVQDAQNFQIVADVNATVASGAVHAPNPVRNMSGSVNYATGTFGANWDAPTVDAAHDAATRYYYRSRIPGQSWSHESLDRTTYPYTTATSLSRNITSVGGTYQYQVWAGNLDADGLPQVGNHRGAQIAVLPALSGDVSISADTSLNEGDSTPIDIALGGTYSSVTLSTQRITGVGSITNPLSNSPIFNAPGVSPPSANGTVRTTAQFTGDGVSVRPGTVNDSDTIIIMVNAIPQPPNAVVFPVQISTTAPPGDPITRFVSASWTPGAVDANHDAATVYYWRWINRTTTNLWSSGTGLAATETSSTSVNLPGTASVGDIVEVQAWAWNTAGLSGRTGSGQFTV